MNAKGYAERLMRSQKLSANSPYLIGEDPPTVTQVAAVLHALADHTLLMSLVSEETMKAGDDHAHLGPGWREATALGRTFQAMGRALEYQSEASR